MKTMRLRFVVAIITVGALAIMGLAAAAQTCAPWRWENPVPQGNDWNALTYGNALWVAVGNAGIIGTSSDGTTWSVTSAPRRRTSLQSLTAAGPSWPWRPDQYFRLHHPHEYRRADLDPPDRLGNGPKPDGSGLERDLLRGRGGQQRDPLQQCHRDHLDGRFHRAGRGRRPERCHLGQQQVRGGGEQAGRFPFTYTIWTSADGNTWSAQSGPAGTAQHLFGVCWNGTIFVAVGNNNKIIKSTDGGTSWSNDGTPVAGPNRRLNHVAWTGKAFVTVGGVAADAGVLIWTWDGVAAGWSDAGVAGTITLTGVAWDQSGLAGVVGAGGAILTAPATTSAAPSTWTRRGQHRFHGRAQSRGFQWDKLRGGGRRGHRHNQPAGVVWTLVTPAPTSADLYAVTWDASSSQYVAVGTPWRLWNHPHEPGGLGGTAASSGTGTSNLRGVAASGTGLEVAVGASGTIAVNSGSGWSTSSVGAYTFNAVAWCGPTAQFIAVGDAMAGPAFAVHNITWSGSAWSTAQLTPGGTGANSGEWHGMARPAVVSSWRRWVAPPSPSTGPLDNHGSV